jgi:hypothetical protein
VVRRLARPLFGDGIVACATDRHRLHRQDLAGLFGAGQLAGAAERSSRPSSTGAADSRRARSSISAPRWTA